MSLRQMMKRLAFVASSLLVAPLLLVVWLEKQLSVSEQFFLFCSQLLAFVPGLPGVWLRAAYYWGTLDACHWEVHFGFGSLFTHRGASVGCRSSTGSYCVLGHAVIGKRVMIGSRVSVPSGKRQHLGADGRLATDAGVFDRVSIGDECWIGEGAIVLADVGRRCIVSAGAVVIKPVADGSLVGGNPAKVLRPVDEGAPSVPLED
jgi:virginiamycin A acetyltransferase